MSERAQQWQIEIGEHSGERPIPAKRWTAVATLAKEISGRELAEWVEEFAREVGAHIIPEARLVRIERTVVVGTGMRRWDELLAPLATVVEE